MTSGPGHTQPERQAGFTLVELVVALVVIAVTLALALTGLRLLGRSGERGAHLIARHDMLSRGADILRRDIERLERVVRRRERDAEFVFSGDERGLAFVLIEPPVPSKPGPYFVVYSITGGDQGSTLVRSRAPFDAAAKEFRRLRTDDDVTVLEVPHSLRFAYQERNDRQERWIPRWLDHRRLPALIKLEFGRASAIEFPPLVFRPHIDAEAGCVKEGSIDCSLRSGGTLAIQPNQAAERKN